MSATNELAALEQRLAALEAERDSIDKRIQSLESDYSEALADGGDTSRLDADLEALTRKRNRLPDAIETLRRRRSDLRARRTLEDAEAKAAAIQAEGEALRDPFATVADAVAGLLPELEGHADFASVLVDGHPVPLVALADALAGHVDRVVRFRVNSIRNNAELRAIQRRAASQSIDPNDLDARYAAGDFELGTRTAEGLGRHHKIR